MTALMVRSKHPAPELSDAPASLPVLFSRRWADGIFAKLPFPGLRAIRSWRGGLPLALLLIALSTLFLFGGDREYFYRERPLEWHDWNSSKTLAIAKNLSLRHNGLMFYYQSRDAAGNLSYPVPYNRFPAGGFALIKLATLPFGDADFRAQIYAGRMLMLLLFSAAAVLAYLALTRIAGSRWDALTATLLAFSSYYPLYYADQISNEITIDLFAVMLAFHGMVIFVQEGRFRQLLVKSCLALLLGWHVYAFLLPFIVFGLAAELLKAGSTIFTPPVLCNLKRLAATLFRSRYLLLGIVTLLFGIAVLAFNFSNEYFALDREVSLWELPSVASAVRRVGLNEAHRALNLDLLELEVFVPNQFYRATHVALPFAVNIFPAKDGPTPNFGYQEYPAVVIGALALIFCLAALAVIGLRRRPGTAALLATLAVSGFCYAVILRYNVAIHAFESVFYIGFPLAVYTTALLCLRRMSRGRLAPFFAVAALTVFAVSASEIAGLGQGRAELAVEAEYMTEYGAIRGLVDDRETIYIPAPHLGIGGGAAYAWAYFLSEKSLIVNDGYAVRSGYAPYEPEQVVNYLLMPTREDSPALLTPEHRHIFMYDWALYNEWHRTADWGRPMVAGDWQVYLRDGHLTYVSPECVNRNDLFLLHFIPQDTADLPARRQGYGYDNRDFVFQHFGITLNDGTCVVERPLPEYDIAAIRTGQYTETGLIWQGEYRLPDTAPSPSPSSPIIAP